MISVADGVGGWVESGVDPAIFARQLCRNIHDLFTGKSLQVHSQQVSGENRRLEYINNPKQLLVEAVQFNTHTGSATACLATIRDDKPLLTTCNLGDSGYLIMRPSSGNSQTDPSKLMQSLVYKSQEQQHSFNFPFQVGTNGDNPERGEVLSHELQIGDVVVMGTDGLWDNMFPDKVLELVAPYLKQEQDFMIGDPHEVAEVIGRETERLSHKQNYLSPFAKNARQNRYDYPGGKPDDITVVVSQIVEKQL